MKKKNKVSILRQVNKVYAKLYPSSYLRNLNNKREVRKFSNNRRNFSSGFINAYIEKFLNNIFLCKIISITKENNNVPTKVLIKKGIANV